MQTLQKCYIQTFYLYSIEVTHDLWCYYIYESIETDILGLVKINHHYKTQLIVLNLKYYTLYLILHYSLYPFKYRTYILFIKKYLILMVLNNKTMHYKRLKTFFSILPLLSLRIEDLCEFKDTLKAYIFRPRVAQRVSYSHHLRPRDKTTIHNRKRNWASFLLSDCTPNHKTYKTTLHNASSHSIASIST